MKTVCVFATLNFASGDQVDVMEHSLFGGYATHDAASSFISCCEAMWKKNCTKYKITNVVIG